MCANAYKYRPQYTQNTIGPTPTGPEEEVGNETQKSLDIARQLCLHCAHLDGIPPAEFDRFANRIALELNAAKLKEAKWWNAVMYLQWQHASGCICSTCKRIAELEHSE
jgi:hypothetical protein